MTSFTTFSDIDSLRLFVEGPWASLDDSGPIRYRGRLKPPTHQDERIEPSRLSTCPPFLQISSLPFFLSFFRRPGGRFTSTLACLSNPLPRSKERVRVWDCVVLRRVVFCCVVLRRVGSCCVVLRRVVLCKCCILLLLCCGLAVNSATYF